MSRQGKHLVHACYCASNPPRCCVAEINLLAERNQAEQYSKRRLGMRWVGEGKEVQGGLGITKPPSKTVCEPSAVYSPKSDNPVTWVKLCAGATLPGALTTHGSHSSQLENEGE